MSFVKEAVPVPTWLPGIYVVSNLTLNTLNWFWFVKMISAVKKRFEPAKEKLVVEEKVIKDGSLVTGIEKKVVRHRRQNSIEDIIPDSEELREGTIQ